MKITIFGSGYVGLVTGACFAEVGNDVLCVDIDEEKISRLKKGEIPIYEPGLEDMVIENSREGRLKFTSDVAEGVAYGLFQFIAVGTPPDEDGSADLRHVLSVAESIGRHMDDYRIIIDKSTVPVGTADLVRDKVLSVLAERNVSIDFDVVSNPEFLKEGDAINDFMKPERIVVGVDNPRTKELLRTLYGPFNRSHERFIAMDIRSAELTKYAANAMLATKISFMNEIANIAERVGADVEAVRRGIGSDSRIGFPFIYPGVGYGGSCFPKDVQALERTARKFGYDSRILQAVEAVNHDQKLSLVDKMRDHFKGDLKGKTIAIWGLAFKPNTDDMREAPSREIIEALWSEGAKVRAYDPVAIDEARRIYGERDDLELLEHPDETLKGADALAVVTEWMVFRSPDFDVMKSELTSPVIFDGRNIYNPDMMEQLGFTYYSIGRLPRCNA
ncbi:MAG: UDP-glucose/GDP-mannose dehydrogenase family protein [Prosthecochloris sp.]|uniref:UDP-glucose 6-dehydrogenase n=1 Tax=Prosthecochloris aestuarii (strain DSM 271 / SK 413) TaxID=290512 RepID=B4S7K5_PROA2|nr:MULTISPECIES: UDP-glucose/GDP-mannose dehydrogenase family protein [Prosthecochloris]ACF46042.1 nucleotide sugar dehydrogenase [Prosthecochloris aestuarii DSM 271]MCW8799089.1 UDP-glucose/GDP-mannose dehydrogenase family protein [Prosthecochloris sp.]NEX11580.1 UDP-glucose/GDP-mannose dehydrogenase family protein [Prosthecochloris sp.]RDD30444.1 UDP-glucose/GDP-mannose dehydrogenase family protein [Prosthecochloris sp. ZM]